MGSKEPITSSFLAKLLFPFLILTILTTGAWAAPLWDRPSIMSQPDGSTTEVRLFGDEFYHWLENPDGYTLVRDPDTGWLCYAEISADEYRLVSTGVRLSEQTPVGLQPGIRLDESVIADIVATKRSRTGRTGGKILDKPPVINGQVTGITILVDFPDLDFETEVPDPAGQQAWMDDVQDFLNLPGYTGHGNNGSIFDYFQDVSGNNLAYSNQVTSGFYESTATRAALNAAAANWDDVVTDILLQMDAEGFDFSSYDSNTDRLIDAINILYWGPLGLGELWPHYSEMVPIVLDGLTAEHYMVSSLRDHPELHTFCHETGHLLGQWPDLYSIAVPRDGFGLGDYCLMAWGGGNELDPVHPSGFPKKLAGWLEPVVLDLPGIGFVATSGNNTGYIIPHPNPSITNEYFLIENRQEIGRDERIDDSGLAVYHVDENQLFQSYSNHYMVHLVQADGLWQLENGLSFGNMTDFYAAPDYPDYDPYSDPRATWWNGDLIESYLQNVSTSGPVMTFDYPGCEQLVSVTITPPDLGFEWTLTGPGGFSYSSTLNNEFIVPACGEYTVSFEGPPLYNTIAPVIQNVGATGDPVMDFAGDYTISFNHGGPDDLGDPGDARVLSAVDYDSDGDDDLFIGNFGSPNRLLINEGPSGFIDATPPNLASASVIVNASWADGDNDGDPDLLLVMNWDGQRILDNQGATMADISLLSPDLSSTGDVTGGNWGDIDNDGVLDLFLARFCHLNQVYEGQAGSPIQLLPGAISGPASAGNATSGVHWGDINNDGWNDLLLSSRSEASSDLTRLLQNVAGYFHFWSGDVNVIHEGKEAVWVDFNNDGHLDIAILTSNGSIALYLIDPGGSAYYSNPFPPNNGVTSIAAGDFNNDGWVDLYVTSNIGSDMLVINQLRSVGGFFQFTTLTFPEDEMLGDNEVAVTGDFNSDGKLDLYVARHDASNFLIENQGGEGNHWLEVDLTGVSCNRDALGARITVTAGGLSQIREVQADGGPGQSSKVAHFGLGTATEVDQVTVRWPGFGPLQVYTDPVEVDSRISIIQPGGIPEISSYIERDGQQLPLEGNNLRGCPEGDGDVLVIELDFDDAYMAGVPLIDPIQISLITAGLGYEFYDDTSLDTPGTPANGYIVTLRRSQIGGCGLCVNFGCNDPDNDPFPLEVRFQGMPVGTIDDLSVQSADTSSDGWVSLQDTPVLAQAVFGTPYNFSQYYCADFIHDETVDLLDIDYFTSHYGHHDPGAAAGSGPAIVSDARVRFLPEASELFGAEEFRVKVRLESDTPFSAAAVAVILDGKVGAYSVVDWEVGADLDGRSLRTTRDKSARREWILTGMNLEKANTRSLEMGVLVLAPRSESGLSATPPIEGDFKILAGEIMTAEGTVESLVQTGGGEQLPALRHGIGRVFPNPFNPSVTIEYALDHPAQVTLQIHDVAGRLVTTLVDQFQTPQSGGLSAVWNGRNSRGLKASSGVYFWRLAIGEQVESGRMMLIK